MSKLGKQVWAVILTKFSDHGSVPATLDFCRKFFTTAGTGGLFDYWRDLSYGQMTLEGSKVLGTYTLSYTLAQAKASADAQHVASNTDPKKRTHGRVFRVQDVINDLADKIDYSPYHGVIVIFNADFDVGATGVTLPLPRGAKRGVPAVCLEPASFKPDMLGHLTEHETGHMLGLPHAARLGAAEEYAARGDTSSRPDYTDGWSIMGGIRDDGSGHDCRFPITNAELLNARSGPGLIAHSVRALGWMASPRVTHYNQNGYLEAGLAALNHPEAAGALMIEATPTDSSSLGFTVELRWKDAWDAGIPRHAFLVHKIDKEGATLLVPRSSTQHDWIAGERFESIADGIAVDFLSIDAAARNGRVRITRVVGQSADGLVAGGWGMVALQRGTGVPFRYLGAPGQWTRVGDPAACFAISGDALYGLASDREKIWRYTGHDRQWVQVGQSADTIVAGGWGMIALQRGTGVPFRFLGTPGQWTQVGDPAAQFAITGEGLYGLSSDRQKIWRYSGTGRQWVQVGESADALVAGGWGLIALQRGTGVPFRYLGAPGKWAQVGGPAAQFAISKDALYGLASDRKKIWRYSGSGQAWQNVGGAAHSIAAGGSTLYSLSPDRSSLSQH